MLERGFDKTSMNNGLAPRVDASSQQISAQVAGFEQQRSGQRNRRAGRRRGMVPPEAVAFHSGASENIILRRKSRAEDLLERHTLSVHEVARMQLDMVVIRRGRIARVPERKTTTNSEAINPTWKGELSSSEGSCQATQVIPSCERLQNPDPMSLRTPRQTSQCQPRIAG